MKKKLLLLSILVNFSISSWAQNDSIYTRTVFNAENDIYMFLDLKNKKTTISGQEFMGDMAGYIGDYRDSRKWFILDAEIIDDNNATLQIVNDECSEDLEATLTITDKGEYILKQTEGSTIKIVRNKKWKKLPKTIIFSKKREFPTL